MIQFMFELFIRKVNEEIPLSTYQKEIIKKYLIPGKLRKKQYLLQEGEVSKSIGQHFYGKNNNTLLSELSILTRCCKLPGSICKQDKVYSA